MKSRRAFGVLLVPAFGLALGLSAALAAVPAAQAAPNGPPVTAPDSVNLAQGNYAAVFPVKNDHDPENELLTICRLGTEHYKGLDVGYFGDEFDVQARPSAKPGAYTYTYYTCDFSYLVPGTITVNVIDLPDLKVKAIKSRPGMIRVNNPFKFKVRFLYGSFRSDGPDGKVLIPGHGKVVIPVQRTKIDWVAFNRKGTLFLGQGHVKGIVLPRAHPRPAGAVRLPARLAQAWRTAG